MSGAVRMYLESNIVLNIYLHLFILKHIFSYSSWKLTSGRTMVINVEYNQLDPLLRATGHADGDVNCETGFSPFPGNINQVIFLTLDINELVLCGASSGSSSPVVMDLSYYLLVFFPPLGVLRGNRYYTI